MQQSRVVLGAVLLAGAAVPAQAWAEASAQMEASVDAAAVDKASGKALLDDCLQYLRTNWNRVTKSRGRSKQDKSDEDKNNERFADYVPAADFVATAESQSDQIRAGIVCALGNIRKNRDGLSRLVERQRGRQTSFDSSIIAVGIGATAAAFFGASAPVIGGLAIGAGGFSQYRSYYGNEARGLAFLRALSASRCVSSSAEPLLVARPESMWKEIHALKSGISVVQLGFSSSDGVATSDQQNAAAQAIAAANTAIAALNSESDALIHSPAVIDRAHDLINDYRDLKKHRTSAGFDAAGVQAALTAEINAATDAATKTRTAATKLADAVKATVTAQAKVDPESVSDGQPIPTDEEATSAQKANEEPAPVEVGKAKKGLMNAVAPAQPAAALTKAAALVAAAAAKTKTEQLQLNYLIASLNQTTTRALDAVPGSSISKTNTDILACVAGLGT